MDAIPDSRNILTSILYEEGVQMWVTMSEEALKNACHRLVCVSCMSLQ